MGSRISGKTTLVAVPESLEELCPSCGEWVNYLAFDHDVGWCRECSGREDGQPRCTKCGGVVQLAHGRTTCPGCRQETWFEKHGDELEYLVVAKGYSLAQARLAIVKMIRPVCCACGKPIKGAKDGALFHQASEYKRCRQAYGKYRNLVRQGLTTNEALATIRSLYQGR